MIKRNLRITSLRDKIKESQLTWYGHVIRRLSTSLIRRYLNMPDSVRCGLRNIPLKFWIKAARARS